jgi:uncharacterized protein DUF6221
MNDLVRWLRDQLDEDERIARAAPMEIDRTGHGDGVPADLPARWVPSHHLVMREPLADDEEIRIVTDCAAFGGSSAAVHIAEWDPARVLRDTDAKRRTLLRCQEEMLSGIPRLVHFAKQTVREMALPYEGRPGYESALAVFE